MRRAPERGPILELNCDRFALLRDVQEMRVAGKVDVVGKQELERRLADEIFVLRVELFVDNGDAAAVRYDFEPRRIRVFEPHMTGARHARRSFGAASVESDLNEIGVYDARRVEPGVGALNGFVRGNGSRGALRRFRSLLR